MKKLLVSIGLIGMLVSFYFATPAHAQERTAGEICSVIPTPLVEFGRCHACIEGGGAWTAIGCINTTPTGFIESLLGLGASIAGGIAFLLILFGGFQILTSSGDPERMQGGRELITSSISGLLLIMFSVFLLRVIGVDILGIPGFEGG